MLDPRHPEGEHRRAVQSHFKNKGWPLEFDCKVGEGQPQHNVLWEATPISKSPLRPVSFTRACVYLPQLWEKGMTALK